MRLKGPFTAHVRTRHPKGTVRVFRCERKTLTAAENFLYWHNTHVEAKWITNAEGIVHTRYAQGSPGDE